MSTQNQIESTMTGSDVLELLESGQDGVAEWNRLRQSGAQGPLAFKFDTNYLDYDSPLNLQGSDFGGCVLSDSNLEGANLTGAHLYQTDMSGVLLYSTKLVGAHLVRAKLDGASVDGARFDRADMHEASLVGIRLGQFEEGASFCGVHADRADMKGANLTSSDFSHAQLRDADLSGARLTGSRFDGADLSGADLRSADLQDTSFIGANLDGADLRNARLDNAILDESRMIDSRLEGANLSGCSVYGVSAWDLKIDSSTIQKDLTIARRGGTSITVDDLEVAQFVYLLMNNARLRNVIDTITSKVVLILGRFTSERKVVLDRLRDTLRGGDFDFVPIVFDFDKPASRTTAETIATFAGMARFVIADLTDAKSILQELREIVPSSPSLPVQPLLLEGQDEPGMMDSFHRYPWFLTPYVYKDPEDLLARLSAVVEPAATMAARIRDNNA